MTTIAASTTTTSATSSTSSSSQTIASDFDAFLTLLITQLQTQSPIDPMDATEFTSQLVQFAGIEQQMAGNEKLDTLIDQGKASQLGTALGYLDRTVEISGDTAPFQDGQAQWAYYVDGEPDSVDLTVTDADGEVVYRTTTSKAVSGRNTFPWDGKDAYGNTVDGSEFTLTVAAVDDDGLSLDAETYAVGRVTGVDTSASTSYLELGDGIRASVDNVFRVAA